MKQLLQIPPMPPLNKILLVFLTLVGSWGMGSYNPPKFFKWLTSEIPFIRVLFQFLFIMILAYQGLGGADLALSFWSTAIFFTVFELVKLIERQFWPDTPAEKAE